MISYMLFKIQLRHFRPPYSCFMPRANRKRGSTSLPKGPDTYSGLSDFAAWQLERWAAFFAEHGLDMENHLAMLGSLTLVITTSYSGVGSCEMSVGMWVKAFASYGISLQVLYYSATEADPLCLQVLGNSPSKPQHLFTNIINRAPKLVVDHLRSLQEQFMSSCQMQMSDADRESGPRGRGPKKFSKAVRALVSRCGAEFLDEACSILKEIDFPRDGHALSFEKKKTMGLREGVGGWGGSGGEVMG